MINEYDDDGGGSHGSDVIMAIITISTLCLRAFKIFLASTKEKKSPFKSMEPNQTDNTTKN